MVALLQLENLDQIWHQTGGSGDDGVDGMGSNEEGEVVGIMQAKLYCWWALELSELLKFNLEIKQYAAILVPENLKPPSDGTILLDLDWIANSVRRNYARLPQALAMRIGKGE